MASKGWVSIHRKIEDDWLWDDKPFSKGQAWIDLLLLVNHEDKKILFNGELIEVKRGQRITSIKKLCERWGWSNTKVKNFLNLLEKDNKIKLEITPRKTSAITIVNYSKYQDTNVSKNVTETSETTQRNVTEASRSHINNNDNNENNDNNDDDNIKKYLLRINDLIKNKSSSSEIERLFDLYGEEKMYLLLEKIEESEYLQEKIIIETIGDKFLKKILNDRYKNFGKVNKKSKSNFKQITDDYSEEELEEVAMRKQREGFKKLGVEI